MTLSDSLLLGMVAILAINYAATRLPGWNQPQCFGEHKFICVAVIFSTMDPDFSAHLEVVNYMISLLFFYHVVENNMRWQKFQQKERRAIIDEERRIMEENIRQYRKGTRCKKHTESLSYEYNQKTRITIGIF